MAPKNLIGEKPAIVGLDSQKADALRALINAFGKDPEVAEELVQDWGDAQNSIKEEPKKEDWGDGKNFIGPKEEKDLKVEVKKAGNSAGKKPREFKSINAPGGSTGAKDARPPEDEELKGAQDSDARALQFIGLGRMLDRSGQELAGMRPDLSFHDNAEKVHASKSKNLGARREENRKQEDQDFARATNRRTEQKHKTEQDQHSSTSPEARALQKFAVENKILSPDQAELLTPAVWAEVLAGKNFTQAIREKQLDRSADLKKAELHRDGSGEYAGAWRDQVALNREQFEWKKGEVAFADWEPIPTADGSPMVTPRNGADNFRKILGQAESLKEILKDMRKGYEKSGAEFFFGPEYERMKGDREAAQQAIQKMNENGVMSGGDKASLDNLLMDPNSIRSALTSKDFLTSLEGIERRTEEGLEKKGRAINLRRRQYSVDAGRGAPPTHTVGPEGPAGPGKAAPAKTSYPQAGGGGQTFSVPKVITNGKQNGKLRVGVPLPAGWTVVE